MAEEVKQPIVFTLENDVEYGNKLQTKSKKADVYVALEAAIKNLVGVPSGKPNSEAVFVANTQLAAGTLSKRLKILTPADGSYIFRVRKAKDASGKVIGIRVYKFFVTANTSATDTTIHTSTISGSLKDF